MLLANSSPVHPAEPVSVGGMYEPAFIGASASANILPRLLTAANKVLRLNPRFRA